VKGVFLDYGTVSAGDLDAAPLQRVLPGIVLHEVSRQDHVIERAQGAAVLFVNKLQIDRAVIDALPALRVIGLTATGTNNVDLVAARERGIAVCNIRDYCTPSVAQHVLGSILALTHRYADYTRLAREQWGQSPQFTMLDYPIRELRGRVLGVVGWGVLGQAVARACEAALGMHVLVAQRAGGEPQPGRLPLAELLPQVDVLTLHCPITPQTQGLIGREQLALMKPDALIVNTARGALLDIDALADALRAGKLGGAAIDVLPQEPPVDGSPLFATDLPNLILTPHTAWAARESRQRAIDEIAANVSDCLAGGRRGRVV
jgi:glycerate dehydrogenase